MSLFDVPKVQQKITIHREKSVRSEGLIFLEYFPEEWPISKKISAFLEDERAFFPFLLTGTNTTELINKDNLYMVEIENPDESEGLPDGLAPIGFITAVFNGTDSPISGELMAETTAERSRPSDCLNLGNRFICVRAGKKTFYINKRMLQKVTPRARPQS